MQIDFNTFPLCSLCAEECLSEPPQACLSFCAAGLPASAASSVFVSLRIAESRWRLAFMTEMILALVLAVLIGNIPEISLEASPARLIPAG